LRLTDSLATATDDSGRALPDLRVWARVPAGESEPQLLVTQPDGAWAAAGLRSGDRIVSWNGTPVAGMNGFRTRLRALRIRDEVTLVYRRDRESRNATVRIVPYEVHRVRLTEVPDATAHQRAVRRGAMLETAK
jgi:S1-C subfamily serine protease